MFNCILFATDGSEHSQKAQQVALDLAKKYGSEVYVVHAYADVSDMLGEPIYDSLVSHRVTAGNAVIAEAAKPFEEAGIKVHRELLEGSPSDAILSVSSTRCSDLIVMGARGLSDLAGLLLGSTSHRVIQHATCPVVVVH